MKKGDRRKRRFGDRRDGRRLRTLDVYTALMPFIMKHKSGASNYFSDSVEITEVEKFLRRKRKEGYPGMGMLHLFIASYIRAAAQYPAINRFLSGQRIFSRHDIEINMVIKKQLRMDSDEATVKINFDRDATITDVYNKLSSEINSIKNEGLVTSTDDAATALVKLPRVILRAAIGLLGCLDYFGKLPQSLLRASPFHGSLIITDLGSIGLPAIYHHLYDFGNLPIFIAIGAKRRVRESSDDGTSILKKYVDYKLVVDERICDGFMFSQAFKVFKDLIRNPEKLDMPPDVVLEDID